MSQPEQCSWSCLNSTQIFLLHPAPWSAATSKGTACSPASGAGFLREVQGQARSQRGMLGEGLGTGTRRRHTEQGGKTLEGYPSPSPLLAQWPGPARPKKTCWGGPGSCREGQHSQAGRGQHPSVRMRKGHWMGCEALLSQARKSAGSAPNALGTHGALRMRVKVGPSDIWCPKLPLF